MGLKYVKTAISTKSSKPNAAGIRVLHSHFDCALPSMSTRTYEIVCVGIARGRRIDIACTRSEPRYRLMAVKPAGKVVKDPCKICSLELVDARPSRILTTQLETPRSVPPVSQRRSAFHAHATL
jgi:hypothetical protein